MISGEESEPSKTEAGPGNQGVGLGYRVVRTAKEEQESRKCHSKLSYVHDRGPQLEQSEARKTVRVMKTI